MLVLCYADCYTMAVVEAIKKRTTRHFVWVEFMLHGLFIGQGGTCTANY